MAFHHCSLACGAMTIICTGVDEAGFGPLLGPLAIAAVTAQADAPEALIKSFARAPLGVRDSKKVHVSGDLRPLETVALAAVEWLTGFAPASASELFALMGEAPDARAGLPWMAGAEDLALPCAAQQIPTWRIRGVEPLGLQGALVHPRTLNDEALAGTNRAAAELQRVQSLLSRVPPGPRRVTRVDRLGGRRYYRDALSTIWPDVEVVVEAEIEGHSTYRVLGPGDATHEISFIVGCEEAWPLAAVASCIAKYARELHMRLFNNYWCGRLRWLKPTAGYATDARRWLHQVGTGTLAAYGNDLLRGYEGNV
jgi:ribonuclease HII